MECDNASLLLISYEESQRGCSLDQEISILYLMLQFILELLSIWETEDNNPS